MKIRVMEWVVLLVVLIPFAAVSEPTMNPANNHYYEVLFSDDPEVPLDDPISWEDAKAAANGMYNGGVQGHLATITSSEEDVFVDTLRQSALDAGAIPEPQVWIGGHQEFCSAGTEPDQGWVWVNGEGSIPSVDNPYAAWADGEPNDAGSGDCTEVDLTLGRYGLGGGWNDEGSAPDSIGGFVVEFDNTTDAQNCVGSPDELDPYEDEGCNLSGMQNVQIPPVNSLPGNAEITEALLRPDNPATDCGTEEVGEFGEFVYRDPRVYDDGLPWDRRELKVFNELGGRPDMAEHYELVLDENTYGSPCFAVVFGSTNFILQQAFPDGVAITRLQFPERVPGIGLFNGCYDPIKNPDLQKTSQLTYQTDDRFEMVEETAAVVTNACFNPSRGSTVRFSFGVLNTAEHCGINFSLPNGPADVLQCFNDLAVAKFDALDQALVLAAPTLLSPKLSSLTKELNKARSMVKNGHFSRAVPRLNNLLGQVNGAEWIVDDRNHPGVLIMRIENLLFRVDQLQQAEANPPYNLP